MASVPRATLKPPFQVIRRIKDPIFLHCSLQYSTLHVPSHGLPRVCSALNTTAPDGPDLLGKPVVSRSVDEVDDDADDDDDDGDEERSNGEKKSRGGVSWEDQILQDTVPLVGFVRMILHSGKYKCGDSLSPEHQRIILERLLPYHPAYERKIGCGVDHIMVGYHPDFGDSKCLFIVRKDGESVDFSYWKCIKGMIKKKYPLHAKSFIFRHFHRHRRN